MDTKTFLDNFGIIAEAPGGIAELRRMILDSAITGLLTSGEPMAWADTTLGVIAQIYNGRAYKKDELLSEGKYRVLRVGNFFTNGSWYWSDLELEESKYCDTGDLLYAWSASFGPRIWEGEKTIYHYHIWKIVEDADRIDRLWLKYWLDNDVDRIKAESGTGTTMMHVTKGSMEKRPIRVPSLAEQQRIVAKVDELMALCDELEEKRQRKATVTTKLRGSAFNALRQAETPDDLVAAWERISTNWSHLTNHPDTIPELRKTILELGMRGRLGVSDGLDQDATREIRPLGEVAQIINGDRGKNYPSRDELVREGVPFVNAGHLKNGRIDFGEMNYITKDHFERLRSGKFVSGDLIYCLRGSLGKAALVADGQVGAIASSLALVRCSSDLYPPFLLMFLVSPSGEDLIRRYDNGTAQPNLAAASLRAFDVPVPPFVEQKQTVNTIDDLMAKCDELEKQLQHQQDLSSRLAIASTRLAG